MTCHGALAGSLGDEVEGAREALAERGPQSDQRPLEEGHVGDAPGEAGELLRRPEARPHEDGLEAIGLPGDADGAVVLEHRIMVGERHTGPMFEERPDIQARLDEELVIWLTTVNTAGQPQTSPVWFLVEDESIVVFSLANTPRTRNIAANPQSLA